MILVVSVMRENSVEFITSDQKITIQTLGFLEEPSSCILKNNSGGALVEMEYPDHWDTK